MTATDAAVFGGYRGTVLGYTEPWQWNGNTGAVRRVRPVFL